MYVCSVYSECKYLVTIHTLNNTVIAAVINKRDEHSVKTYCMLQLNIIMILCAWVISLNCPSCLCMSVCLVGVFAQDPGLI